MNETKSIQTVAPVSSFKMLRAMVGIGVLCALMIVLTFEGTLERIEKNKAEALEKAIFKVVPGISKKKAFRLDENNQFLEITDEEKSENIVYAGYNDEGKLKGIALEASGMGFADILRILYGYDLEKQAVVGFYVLESKETPGLGDKIEKDAAFLENFKALDVSLSADLSELKNKVVPVKQGDKKNPWEVDGITGATISSRAIGNILGESTAHWMPVIYKNKEVFE
jgi:electron transport complex protein RnfG